MTREELGREIEQFVAEYRHSRDIVTKWRTPLVGIASAGDTLFETLRQVVSPSHALPGELLPDARSVVAFFLPFDESIGRSNITGIPASREWAQAYVETNKLIEEISRHMQRCLIPGNYMVAITPATHNFDPVKLISDWSHRHIAFIAGLGRFGVNNMLITDSGCCGRFGSFVTSLALKPNERSERESCLYHYDASCLRCLERCPHEALFTDHFNRNACYAACLKNEEQNRSIGRADVCGKCLTGIPCSFINPVRNR
jgi:epoxyqueuosine reductase QueG